VVGEALLAQVVQAIGASPAWPSTLFVLVYDEHGGYYDHVPPSPALAPDGIAPLVNPGESSYDGFGRYGFRVPSVVVSPYARRRHVSHMLYDHTSVLAMLERKWNLPALTYRDANANDLSGFLDLGAWPRGGRRSPCCRRWPRRATPPRRWPAPPAGRGRSRRRARSPAGPS
jgi:phospholipase C